MLHEDDHGASRLLSSRADDHGPSPLADQLGGMPGRGVVGEPKVMGDVPLSTRVDPRSAQGGDVRPILG
jgi:hypothetical protein